MDDDHPSHDESSADEHDHLSDEELSADGELSADEEYLADDEEYPPDPNYFIGQGYHPVDYPSDEDDLPPDPGSEESKQARRERLFELSNEICRMAFGCDPFNARFIPREILKKLCDWEGHRSCYGPSIRKAVSADQQESQLLNAHILEEYGAEPDMVIWAADREITGTCCLIGELVVPYNYFEASRVWTKWQGYSWNFRVRGGAEILQNAFVMAFAASMVYGSTIPSLKVANTLEVTSFDEVDMFMEWYYPLRFRDGDILDLTAQTGPSYTSFTISSMPHVRTLLGDAQRKLRTLPKAQQAKLPELPASDGNNSPNWQQQYDYARELILMCLPAHAGESEALAHCMATASLYELGDVQIKAINNTTYAIATIGSKTATRKRKWAQQDATEDTLCDELEAVEIKAKRRRLSMDGRSMTLPIMPRGRIRRPGRFTDVGGHQQHG